MKKGKIGIQFSTIRPALEQMSLYDLLKACAELGYHCIEISQIPMTAENVSVFQRAWQEFGMEIAAINAGIESIRPGMECLEKDYDKIVSDCRALDCHMLRIGSGPIFDLHSREDVLDYCRKVDVYAERLKNDGIDYYYHNHAFEFQRFEGETMLDTMRLHSKVGFELDIHWIHAGGEDLIFPHHENEIAQSECANGKTFANYWMHNAFLNIDNRKMSKSLGNFFTVREISEKYDLQVLRLFMLSAQYRSPLNFSADLMEASKNSLERIRTAAEHQADCLKAAKEGEMTAEEKQNQAAVEELVQKFETAMDDDFNTADAISAIFEIVRLSNSTISEASTKAYVSYVKETMDKLCDVLGIITEKKEEILDSEVEDLIAKRQQARKDKNFALADEIRGQLLDMGIILEDTREGVKWKRA